MTSTNKNSSGQCEWWDELNGIDVMEPRKKLHFVTTRTKPVTCLGCGADLNAATSVYHKRTPYPGAVAICFVCNHIQIYDENLQFRNLNDKEMHDIAGNKELLHIIEANSAVKAQVAVQKEVDAIVEAKIKECEPVIAYILNPPIPDMMFCATDKSMPTYAGYGATPKEALRNLIHSFAKETYNHAVKEYRKRERAS